MYKKGMVTADEIDKVIRDGKMSYLILLGQRSNGKSYAVKHLAVREAYKNRRLFIYLRRYKEDIADYLTEQYFQDLDVTGITDGKYNTISVYRKGIYVANLDEEGNLSRGEKIGDVRALANAERYKSGAYKDYKYIIFEEFITDGTYIANEVEKLDSFISTILRQNDGCILLVGNTISRICPYYREYGLDHIRQQKQGTVDIYKKEVTGDEGTTYINIGVYLTGTIEGASKMFFRKSAGMINRGEWTTNDYPHRKECDTEVVYRVVYIHDNNTFLCDLLSGYDNPLGMIWFIYPKTKNIKEGSRIISKNVNDMYIKEGTLWTADFRSAITPQEQQAFKLLLDGYVCFSDNLTGTEFYQCMKQDGLLIRGK